MSRVKTGRPFPRTGKEIQSRVVAGTSVLAGSWAGAGSGPAAAEEVEEETGAGTEAEAAASDKD